MFPSIYEHWGITLTVIGGGYVVLALLWCRLLGFNRPVSDAEREPQLRSDSKELSKLSAITKDLPGQPTSPPDAAVRPDCRAEELLYTTAYVECLTDDNEGCPHRLGYGQASFCHHPHRDKIVTRTDAATD
jgi:hypothetical protein